MFKYQNKGLLEKLVFGLCVKLVNTQLKHFQAFCSLWGGGQRQIQINNNKPQTTLFYKLPPHKRSYLPKSGPDTES